MASTRRCSLTFSFDLPQNIPNRFFRILAYPHLVPFVLRRRPCGTWYYILSLVLTPTARIAYRGDPFERTIPQPGKRGT